MTDSARDFQRADRVLSPCRMPGVVTKVEAGTVFVEYREIKRGEERVTRGIYTPEWFARWPGMLVKVL